MKAEFLSSPILSPKGLHPVRHAFFTRRGGVSTGPFESLNCSLRGPDDIAHVRENRARAAAVLNVHPPLVASCTQVHGAEVAVVDASWHAQAERPRADAMVTRRRGVALSVITADCTPVLLAGRDADGNGVAAAVHAGWRGAVAGVLEATVAAMRELGAAGPVAAAIGPCIHQRSYEVGPDLRDAVLARDETDDRFFAPGKPGHWQFDLPGYCAARLRALEEVEVDAVDADTLSNPAWFFSYRRTVLQTGGSPVGHQISMVAL